MEAATENRTMKRRRLIRILIAVPLCLVAGIGLLLSLLSYQIEREKHPTLRMVSRFTGLGFPHGSVLVNSAANVGWGDCHLFAKIRMDRSQVGSFIKSLPKSRMLRERDVMSVSEHEDSLPWWDPRSTPKLREIFIFQDEDGGGFREWRMLIRLDDPQIAVLYLEFLED